MCSERARTLLVFCDSLSYYGPTGGLPSDDPRIWPNIVADQLGWRLELIGRIGWTSRDVWWAATQDPRSWAALPGAGAVIFATSGMDSLPSPLPTALREMIRWAPARVLLAHGRCYMKNARGELERAYRRELRKGLWDEVAEAAAEAGVTLAYMCRLGEASQVVATGTWDGESLDDAVQLAASGCARVDAALREALRSSVPA